MLARIVRDAIEERLDWETYEAVLAEERDVQNDLVAALQPLIEE